jgi:hypothetical protein
LRSRAGGINIELVAELRQQVAGVRPAEWLLAACHLCDHDVPALLAMFAVRERSGLSSRTS